MAHLRAPVGLRLWPEVGRESPTSRSRECTENIQRRNTMSKLFSVLGLLSVLALSAMAQAADCCKPGDTCCKPGNPCCKK